MSAADCHVWGFISWYLISLDKFICNINYIETATLTENQTLFSLRIERKVGAPILQLAKIVTNFNGVKFVQILH
jgi:hypothetical protein